MSRLDFIMISTFDQTYLLLFQYYLTIDDVIKSNSLIS